MRWVFPDCITFGIVGGALPCWWPLPVWYLLISIQNIDRIRSLTSGNISDWVSLVTIIHHLSRLHNTYVTVNVKFPSKLKSSTSAHLLDCTLTFGSLHSDLQGSNSCFACIHSKDLWDIGTHVVSKPLTEAFYFSCIDCIMNRNREWASYGNAQQHMTKPSKQPTTF